MDSWSWSLTDAATQLRAAAWRATAIGDAEARARIASQMPLAEKAKLADYVIDNSGDRADDRAPGARGLRALLADLKTARAAAAMSPRRNARATRGPPRPATRGKTRALGQHFLRDTGVAHRDRRPGGAHARATSSWRSGPGEGALTGQLAPRAGPARRARGGRGARRAAARALRRLAARRGRRRRRARASTTRALRRAQPDPGGRVLVVGNLPYSVGKPILMALVEAGAARSTRWRSCSSARWPSAWRRRPARKVYGSLSVLTQVACDVRLAFGVPPGAFSPPPQVDSAVIHLRRRAAPPVPIAEPARFRAVVRAAFAQRRKNLANALAAGLGGGAERARLRVAAAGIDPGRRAETLSLAEFARLAEALAG